MSVSNENFNLQEKDVYEFAYEIAQEFENILNSLDIELMIPVINKVVNVLEILEQSIKRIEHLDKENSDVKSKLLLLNNEKKAREAEVLNLKLAFEELEKACSEESVLLKSFIDKLKAENKLLQSTLTEKNDVSLEIGDSYKVVIGDQEKLISKLKTNLKQRDNQLEKKSLNIEALNSKIESLSEANKVLHNQYEQAKKLEATSHYENNEYKMKLHQQRQEINSLKERFLILKQSLCEKNEDLASNESKSQDEKYYLSEESLNCLLQEQQELKQKVLQLQKELAFVKNQNVE
ncbi:RH1 domain-containing protein [Caerostris extrusa]|uniref:RH1 domain-containing protein n=1 Tax=Caerostris extrusa TaxID=172846 RepID=A0AAV4Q3S1_CAEEX|nr:RH1 domain-containing protein [Caerostris extrusa]